MFRSALEPDIFDEADEVDDAKVVEYTCLKETFVAEGKLHIARQREPVAESERDGHSAFRGRSA
jgi:hypothetical protein